ncbi:MAG TPA: aminopeptidase [Thermoplasmata archaeon]|nr:aminopeptidase [Thermoplasmata archaeon]
MTVPTVDQADQLARSVLTRRLQLRPKENVTIETYPSSLPWAAGFVREARRLGAKPLLHYEDEASYWAAVDEGRGALIGAPGEHEWAALEGTDVYIYFWGPEDLARRSRLPEAEQEKLTAFNRQWYDVARKAKLRGARMMIARVTEANARRWGTSVAAWRKEMVAASLRDPALLRRDAERVRRAFERGREVRIRHPNGTDLTLALAHRPVQVALGVVTPEGRKSPFGSMVNVPDGSVYTSVDEGTADGTLVANRATTLPDGQRLGGRFRFKDGRLVGFRYAKGGAGVAREFRSAGAGRDRPSFLEVGLDPSIDRSPGLEEAVRGAVTVGVGGNVGFGGKTKVDFLSYVTVAGPELRIDGRPLVRNGRIVG